MVALIFSAGWAGLSFLEAPQRLSGHRWECRWPWLPTACPGKQGVGAGCRVRLSLVLIKGLNVSS